jgi:HEAT repeat protein
MFAPKIAKPHTKTATHSISLERPRSTLASQRHSPAEQMLLLQDTIGNQATLRLLSQLARNRTENEPHGHNEQKADPASAARPGASWDLSKIPLFPCDRVPQKLAVGQLSDPLEHEADRIADHVMRTKGPALSLAAGPSDVSRNWAAGEEEGAKTLQTTQPDTREGDGHMASELRALHGSGLPLPKPRRTFFEARFGYDFTGIRIHSDSRAAKLAASANARAFTLGQDIVFGAGEYSPDTGEGTRLLAHELVHVVQQRRSQATIQRQPATKGDPFALEGVYDQLDIVREGSLPEEEFKRHPELRKLSFSDWADAVQTLRFRRKLNAIIKLGDLRDERAVLTLVAVVEDKLFVAPKDFTPSQKDLLQQEAVAALGKIGGPVALAKLNDLLNSTDPKERMLATRGFYTAAGGQAATDLLTALKKETNPSVKAQIISALGNIAGGLSIQEKELIVKELIREMENSSGDVLPRAAIDALGKIKLKSATEPLLNQLKQHLSHSMVHLTEDIIRALGEIGDDRAVWVLVAMLETHWSNFVRSEAAIALGKICGKKALDALKRSLSQEKEDSVKAAISKALKACP